MTHPEKDRASARQALFEETVEELYEHAPCGYLSTLPDGTIARVNQTFVDWTGASRQSLLSGRKFQTLLATGSRIYYETHYAPLLRMQGFADEIAMDMIREDGRVVPVLINSRQKRDSDGRPLFNRITVFDSTDRRRYERELLVARRKAEQIAKDKADLLAMLSHDIRNPLTAVMGVVSLLELSELTGSQSHSVNLLRVASETMLALLNRVLDLSKAESGSFVLVETPFALHDVIADVVLTFGNAAREKGLQLNAVVAEALPAVVLGDAIAIQQIVSNLVGNALKFTSSGSVTVTVDIKQLGTDAVTVACTVSDTGIGIAPDALECIFDEFTQASYDTATKYGGVGLGLAITRRLLSLYGSTVHVQSTPGQGSTFSFDLRLSLPRSGSPCP